MPAPGICEGAILTFMGLTLGFGTPRFLRGLDFTAGGGEGAAVAAFASAACLRACAVLLLVLCLIGVDITLRVVWLFVAVEVVGVSSIFASGDGGVLVPMLLLVVGEGGLL